MTEHGQAAARLMHVPAERRSSSTAQTEGMRREAAISGPLVGAERLWMGVTTVAPGATSGPHHHGHSETGIYVVSGAPRFVYCEGDDEVAISTRPGDFVYVPAYCHHIESNAHSDVEAVVVIARTTQEAIVENLDELCDTKGGAHDGGE
jgi:uncharacterized RmlC-like cupin family protein